MQLTDLTPDDYGDGDAIDCMRASAANREDHAAYDAERAYEPHCGGAVEQIPSTPDIGRFVAVQVVTVRFHTGAVVDVPITHTVPKVDCPTFEPPPWADVEIDFAAVRTIAKSDAQCAARASLQPRCASAHPRRSRSGCARRASSSRAGDDGGGADGDGDAPPRRRRLGSLLAHRSHSFIATNRALVALDRGHDRRQREARKRAAPSRGRNANARGQGRA